MHSAGFYCGLHPTQWAVLRFLARANPSSCTLTAFAAVHSVTRSSAAQSIRRLIARKLVRYERSATDGRVRYLSLTADGIAVLERDPLAPVKQALQTCMPESIDQFVVVLSTITRQMVSGKTEDGADQ
jgi:DNA-binding MarR family transcriptional regulator